MLTEVNETNLLDRVDELRIQASAALDPQKQLVLSQFLTPPSVARMMASMPQSGNSSLSILDAGAGVGTLSAACVADFCTRPEKPRSIRLICYEVDQILIPFLQQSLDLCSTVCEKAGIELEAICIQNDFLEDFATGSKLMRAHGMNRRDVNIAVINPPYQKLGTKSETRRLLRHSGIDANNLYSAFLMACIRLLEPYGELVAITPRSFCNGPHHRKFRRALVESVRFRRIHVFESRERIFADSKVLQEMIVLHAIKSQKPIDRVVITSSLDAHSEIDFHEVAYDRVVRPDDPEVFIRLSTSHQDELISRRIETFPASLSDLGLEVSTGPLVDFRNAKYLRRGAEVEGVPLICPSNIVGFSVQWPNGSNGNYDRILCCEHTLRYLVPNENYVLVKRMSSKEDKKRVVAAVFDSSIWDKDWIALENHLNYFHCAGRGLSMDVAWGLAAFLNSSLVDRYIRQFNGHTQVNATDLRSLRYPTLQELRHLGSWVLNQNLSQKVIDDAVDNLVYESIQVDSGEYAGTEVVPFQPRS